MPKDVQISKFMSLVLRHAPQKAGLKLDENGWVELEKLSAVLRQKFNIDDKYIRHLIETNPKKRFQLSDGNIRAAQGHSVKVDLKLSEKTPPETLYHGTTTAIVKKISKEGLIKQNRHHVHLSADMQTAKIVAIRRKQPWSIFAVNAKQMTENGFKFFLSENNVWLTDNVPSIYLSVLSDERVTQELSKP